MRAGEAQRHRAARARGFTYVVVLAMIAISSVGAAALGTVWSEQSRREREQELLRIGRLYADAIASYHAASPGVAKRYPPTLESLLLDTRFVGTVRHLRKVYADPVEPGRPWGLVLDADGNIKGVFSQSERPPLRQAPLQLGRVHLARAERYSDWKFIPETPL